MKLRLRRWPGSKPQGVLPVVIQALGGARLATAQGVSVLSQ